MQNKLLEIVLHVAILNNQPIIIVCFLCQKYHKINNNCTIIHTNNATDCIVFTDSAIIYQPYIVDAHVYINMAWLTNLWFVKN